MKYRFILFASICGLFAAGCGSDDQSDVSPASQNSENHIDGQNSATENQNQVGNSDNNPSTDNDDKQNPVNQKTEIDHTDNWIGPMTPEDALEYMKATYPQGLLIVDVTPPEYKLERGFTGSIYIPYTELETRSDEIPPNKPVILHCVRGKASAKAYPILEEKRKDIPVLSYIAGEPLIDEFNTWLAQSGIPTGE